jgi:hypothetical protein
MTSKSRKNHQAGQLLDIQDTEEFFERLDLEIGLRGPLDFMRLPKLGQMIVGLREVESVSFSEDLLHYVTYCGDRWRGISDALSEIGALQKAGIFRQFLSYLEDLPEDQRERVLRLEEYDDDPELQKLNARWHESSESVLELLRNFLARNESQLQLLIDVRQQDSRQVPKKIGRQEIERRAYLTDLGAFEGLESCLIETENIELLIDLVRDEKCPTRGVLLNALYACSGNAASEVLALKGQSNSVRAVQNVVEKAAHDSNREVREWALQSRKLLAQPDPMIIMNWMGRLLTP